MSFGGELRTFEVFDLFEWLWERRRTGQLQLVRRSTRKQMAFATGLLVSTSSNDPRETIGQVLVRDGLVDEETLFRALLKQEREGGRLGQILVTDGEIGRQQLSLTLQATAEVQLLDVLLWTEGRFDFDDTQPPREPTELAIELPPLLAEGRRRREESKQLRQRFPSNEITFRLTADPVAVREPALRQMLNVAAWGRTLAAISLETRRPEHETMQLLARLCDEGFLAPDRIEAGGTESDPVGAILGLVAGAEQRLRERRFDSAIECYERVLALDPVNQAAKKGLVAVSEARQRARAALSVPLDKVPALRLTALALSQLQFEPAEGFVLSRINGQWDVHSILKLCPMPEDETLLIFSRLLDRKIIELR